MKLACVVHRYGTDVTGGSEAHCRSIAEHLAKRHDVTVLSTTARNYVTWRNAYPAGETRVDGVRVLRFQVQRPRRLHAFRDISDLVFTGAATLQEQARWFDENGPIVPGLTRARRRHALSGGLPEGRCPTYHFHFKKRPRLTINIGLRL